ncbi:TPA: TetR/AcrR family transcriptional regulator, partial [Stenotrophomonas maltophilia]|nr:TetR/AcrR family transcriptional regulator [Stenotrophomonas maltophilia]
QLLGILEAGNAAGLWHLAAPKVTASLIYAGVHGATDDLIAAPAPDADAFIAAVQADCLRMVGVQPTGAKRR